MNIDYDGLQLVKENEINEAESRLIGAVIDAMKDGEIPTVSLSFEWVICDYCRGNGGHSRRFGVISHDDWNDWSDETRHAYSRGHFDADCDACRGSGKVRELDLEHAPSEIAEWVEAYRTAVYESAQESYYERLAGC
jgi:hypothetical protein